jgi:hypothetical protein
MAAVLAGPNASFGSNILEVQNSQMYRIFEYYTNEREREGKEEMATTPKSSINFSNLSKKLYLR